MLLGSQVSPCTEILRDKQTRTNGGVVSPLAPHRERGESSLNDGKKESEAFPPRAKRSVSKNIGRARGGRPAGFRQQGIHIRDDSCHTLRLEADP